MRKHGGIARTAAAAALAATLAIGGIAPNAAFAEVGDGTGSITITAVSGNEGMTYDAYKLFTCDVDLKAGSDTEYVATSIEWASEEMKDKVEGAIQRYDNTYQGTTAQDAADYIAAMISGGQGVRVQANGFAENLAKAIDDTTSTATLTAGQPSKLAEGYYMIVSHPDSAAGAKVGTSPIFTMLGNGQELTITEKTSVPTITKTVAEEADGNGSSYIDAQAGQAVEFALTGTVSDSIVTFTKYSYTFEDTLPAGMDLVCAGGDFAESDVKVQVVLGSTTYDVDDTSFAASYSGGKLTVAFDDLRAATSNGTTIPVDASANVVVTYKAALNASATVGASGNENSATLTYGNNPQDPESTGTSAATCATVYEYQLKLYKYDEESLESAGNAGTALEGAKFTIQATAPDDAASKNKYVQADWTLGSTAYEFTTGSDGSITVKGLDAGTYTIKETAQPSGYAKLSTDMTLVITPSFWAANDTELSSNEVGSLKALTATLSGGNGDENTKVASIGDDKGTVTMNVTNKKKDGNLPLTGLPGITLVYVVGGAILAVSLATIVRRRLKDQG